MIVGNPPFLGDKKMRAQLGDQYVDDLRPLYGGRVAGGADLVTYWFERSRALIDGGAPLRVGLLATNGIRYGENRRVLERVRATGRIFLAWSDRPWVIDGAAVRVSMIGFDDGSDDDRWLDGSRVAIINPDLTTGVDLTSAKELAENAGLGFLGMMKAGPFDIDDVTAQAMLAAPVNPNGRPNHDVVRPRLGGTDVTRRPRAGFIIDFAELSPEAASLYEAPFEYVLTHVKPARDGNKRDRTRRRWWLFGENRPGLRWALSGLKRCIVTPEVAKHRVFVWMDTEVVPDHTLHVITRDDDYFFGVLHSRPHELWSLAVGNWMGAGNDPRCNSSRTLGTFAFPWAPGDEPTSDPRFSAQTKQLLAVLVKRIHL